mmetsp:Transcript_29233/g.68363  ORF Transcript_29233/g.68363 Transcript_29233/m.68363 type:complete len:344 (+) Transcript_29233:7160-8191(+)
MLQDLQQEAFAVQEGQDPGGAGVQQHRHGPAPREGHHPGRAGVHGQPEQEGHVKDDWPHKLLLHARRLPGLGRRLPLPLLGHHRYAQPHGLHRVVGGRRARHEPHIPGLVPAVPVPRPARQVLLPARADVDRHRPVHSRCIHLHLLRHRSGRELLLLPRCCIQQGAPYPAQGLLRHLGHHDRPRHRRRHHGAHLHLPRDAHVPPEDHPLGPGGAGCRRQWRCAVHEAHKVQGARDARSQQANHAVQGQAQQGGPPPPARGDAAQEHPAGLPPRGPLHPQHHAQRHRVLLDACSCLRVSVCRIRCVHGANRHGGGGDQRGGGGGGCGVRAADGGQGRRGGGRQG